MVAVIGSGTSVRRTFLYNENKVRDGVAQCIMAANYPLELEEMNGSHRLNMLLKTVALNPDVKRNSIHISLNFAPGERLDDTQLRAIATDYMEQIGFGFQPFLIYRHDDAVHPHMHIVTTKIRPDGTRIDTQNIGRLRSEPVRKMIEEKYGLVKAEDQKEQLFKLMPVNVARVIYGKETTKKAINNVLQSVLAGYKFTSLPELNAVLNLYNIAACPGTENSRIYKHNGLVYKVLDENGNAVGVPVKASAFFNNPGIKFLEKRYLRNDVERQQHKTKVKNIIDLLLLRNPGGTLEQLANGLKTEGVQLVVRQNDQGVIYGLTYVDHRTRCVFNGSALGKRYSAKGIQERATTAIGKVFHSSQNSSTDQSAKDTFIPLYGTPEILAEAPGKSLIEELMQPEFVPHNIPFEWRKRKKKKKKGK